MPKTDSAQGRAIVIAGDVTVDWNIARARTIDETFTSYQHIWGSDIGTRATSQAGGAALLTHLLGEFCKRGWGAGEKGCTVVGPTIPIEEVRDPSCSRYTRSYSVWSPFPRRVGDKARVWRASEFWGFDAPIGGSQPVAGADRYPEPWGLVVDDANLGLRRNPDVWPAALKTVSPRTEWILLKLAHPVMGGALWKHLLEQAADRLTLVVSVSDLRKADLQIGYELSWEQTASEILQAVRGREDLSRPRAVVVVLGATGAVVIEKEKEPTLIYDAMAQEADFKKRQPGNVIGYASCYVAALVRGFLLRAPELAEHVRHGVQAARVLHESGYAAFNDKALLPDLRFPVEAVLESIAQDGRSLASIPLGRTGPGWSILGEKISSAAEALASDIVRRGPDVAISQIPLERIGRWSSIDRAEIESIRSLRMIMQEYMKQSRPSRPLSLAVFGPPGAGKSFAVKEVASDLFEGQATSLEFNLSQFDSPAELPAAFHRIRDIVLRGQRPLVFWDEFDTPLAGQKLGWLRYFLAPMQDGEFREGGLPHPLGPAIFVFAGGTHATMVEFRETAAREDLREAKGRDFLSRLRGFLNVLGPDRRDARDQGYLLRRALLLRSILWRSARKLFDGESRLGIDEGVLRAFLTIDGYRHGARSMECIVDMSALSGKLKYERACLPAPHQLDLHVDAGRFLALIDADGGSSSGPAKT